MNWIVGVVLSVLVIPETLPGTSLGTLASHAPSHYGTSFTLAFTRQVAGATTGWNRVYINSYATAATGTISSPLQSYTQTFSVAAYASTHVDLPLYFRVNSGSESLAVYITSSADVSVYALNSLSAGQSLDGTIIWPDSLLDTEYILTSFTPYQSLFLNQYSSSTFTVVPTQAATSFQLFFYDTTIGAWTSSRTYLINQLGQTFTVNSTSVDYTGWRIVSSAAVAVFAGSDCAVVPSSGVIGGTAISSGCDMIVHMMLPTTRWGDSYFAFPDPNGFRQHTIRVTSMSTVEVSLSVAGSSYTATPGSFAEFTITTSAAEEINCNDTCQVTTYMHYWLSQLSNFGTDPYMVHLVPTRWWSHEYIVERFDRGSTWTNGELAIVIIATSNISTLVIQSGALTISNWQAIGSTGHSIGTLSLTGTGPFQFTHTSSTSRFGLYVTGQGVFEGYAYAAGFMDDYVTTTTATTLTAATVTTTEAPEDTGLPVWVYAVIVVAAVMILVAVALALYFCLRKKEEPPPDEEEIDVILRNLEKVANIKQQTYIPKAVPTLEKAADILFVESFYEELSRPDLPPQQAHTGPFRFTEDADDEYFRNPFPESEWQPKERTIAEEEENWEDVEVEPDLSMQAVMDTTAMEERRLRRVKRNKDREGWQAASRMPRVSSVMSRYKDAAEKAKSDRPEGKKKKKKKKKKKEKKDKHMETTTHF